MTREDCAAAAAAVLTQDGHENRVYDITGPQALSPADLAVLAGEISGREVEVVQVDDESYRNGLVRAGLPQPVAELIASFAACARAGFAADVSTAVPDLAGRPAVALRDVLRQPSEALI